MTPPPVGPRTSLDFGDPGAPTFEGSHRTCGDWNTEDESMAALDDIIEHSGLFMIYREVRGFYLQPRLDQELKRPRIDRVLVPRPSLIQGGWQHGPIGVEGKRSGERVGPAIAQILDYSRAAWLVEPSKGLWVMLPWLFLWPAKKTGGTVASILAQHRVGTAEPTYRNGIKFATGEQVLGSFGPAGTYRIGKGTNGRKAGSR